MSLIKKILLFSIFILFIAISKVFAEDLKKIGKYKDWEVIVMTEASGKVCFAQSTPVLQAPKSNKRDARLFVTFRPSEKISNEISATAGYLKNGSLLCRPNAKITPKPNPKTHPAVATNRFTNNPPHCDASTPPQRDN